MGIGDSQDLTATVLPNNATNKAVSWTSSNPAAVTVSNSGLVKGIAAGTATITATTEDGGLTATCNVEVVIVPVSSITLDKTSVNMGIGDSQDLTATVLPNNATNKAVSWTSSNPAAVTVSNSGLVKGIAAGTATITATTEDGGLTATCNVEVVIVPVSSITLDKTSVNMGIGGSQDLTATVLPANATNKAVSWTSSNPAAVTVTSSGLVKGIAAGTATITATTEDGGLTATCTVEVVVVPVSSITLDKTTLNMGIGDSQDLTATVLPNNATNKAVSWTSSNPEVATVSNSGLVTAIAGGSVTITATTEDGGFAAYCGITVTVPVKTVFLNHKPRYLSLGQTITLIAVVLPSNATNKAVTFSSSNPAVATVDSEGKVTGISLGNATITVTTIDGGHTNIVDIPVIIPITSLSINKDNTNLNIGAEETLIANVLPDNATETVYWDSSNREIATVDSNGKVTAISNGTSIIIAYTKGTKNTATCSVTVTTLPVSSISLDNTTLNIGVGDSRGLTATIMPANASNKAVRWTSSNPTVATVNSQGLVNGVNAGSAIVTATTDDGGYTATCNVEVNNSIVHVSSISLDRINLAMITGDYTILVATVNPNNATDKSVAFTTSDPSIAIVDAFGKVTAVSVGSAIITATTNDGGKKATCNVTVNNLRPNNQYVYDSLNRLITISMDNKTITYQYDSTGNITGVSYTGTTAGENTNLALNKSYTKFEQPDSNYADSGNESTDGIISGDYSDGKSYGYRIPRGESKSIDIVLDMGQSTTINKVKANKLKGILNYGGDTITVYTSEDGASYQLAGSCTSSSNYWYSIPITSTNARYVKVNFTKYNDGSWGNDWLFIDEIKVF